MIDYSNFPTWVGIYIDKIDFDYDMILEYYKKI